MEIQGTVSPECVLLWHHCKVKKRKLTPPKSGIVCTVKVLGGVGCDDIKPDQFVGTSGFCT